MSGFSYTPYDGTATPFTIGLRQLEPERWFEPDENLVAQLAEKRLLIARDRQAVYQAQENTRAAQAELLELMLDYLPARYPDLCQRDRDKVSILPADTAYRISAYADDPLLLCGQLVQDDLALIEVTEEGPVLAAASLCFPSSWRLADKIGRHLDQVHGPVPGYQVDMAGKVNRMIERLPPDRIIWRLNWSLDEGPALHRPEPHSHDRWLKAGGDPMDHVFIRVERQTLRRLPETGYILFTIRIYSDALGRLKDHPEAPEMARALRGQLAMMTGPQLAYKGLEEAAPAILAALAAIG